MLLKYNSINRANYYRYSYFNKKLLNINSNVKLQFRNNTISANNTAISANNTISTNNTAISANNTISANNNTISANNNTISANNNTISTNNNYKKQFIHNLKKIEMHESHSIKPYIYTN